MSKNWDLFWYFTKESCNTKKSIFLFIQNSCLWQKCLKYTTKVSVFFFLDSSINHVDAPGLPLCSLIFYLVLVFSSAVSRMRWTNFTSTESSDLAGLLSLDRNEDACWHSIVSSLKHSFFLFLSDFSLECGEKKVPKSAAHMFAYTSF